MKRLRFYAALDKIPFLNSMAMKVVFVAFIGIHLPLILSVLLLVGFQIETDPLHIIGYLLTFTLVATFFTLYFLNKLIQPVRYLSVNLRCYISGTGWSLPDVPIKDETGSLLRDVSECVENLEKTIAEKNDMYSLLSHDLKSTLATLQSGFMLQEMENKEPSTETRDNIELIERQILAINSLLYYYKENNGSLNNETPNQHSLKKITEEVCNLYHSALRLENKSISVSIPENATVLAGKFLLRHFIFNLVDNAIKYSEKNSCIQISYSNNEFYIENAVSKNLRQEISGWKKSTGLGQKIISQTARELGFNMQIIPGNGSYAVRVKMA